ncbi:MAG: HAD hydrolase family protein, partial [Clostridia bacterium]|nr:HAD hydrolase family protein [Clostridia bacterium]
VEYHTSGCVTFPILGTRAIQQDKLAFDPDRKKRRAIYNEVREAFSDYNVFVGGSSSFDMSPKPYDKYYALDLYCKENNLSHENVVYIGDDYGFGGNDESIYNSDFNYLVIDDYKDFVKVVSVLLD